MKKIVYALVLAILLPLFSANAENLSLNAERKSYSPKNLKVTKEMLLTPRTDFMSLKNNNKLQANEYYTKLFASTPFAFYIGYAGITCPMAYDPTSGILIYSTTNWRNIGGVMHTTVNLYSTMDMGQNWSKDSIGTFSDDQIFVSPSIGVSNTNNGMALQDLNIVTFTRYAAKAGTGYNFAGGYYQVKTNSDYQYLETKGPDEGENASFYNWNGQDMSVYQTGGETSATSAGVLFPNNDFAQYGTYGQASINIDSYDTKFSIPNEWSNSNFWLTTSFNNSYNSRMLVDADNFGNVYSCVFNYCNNNDNDSTRTPAVSKSTDGGNTWSSLNLCPAKVIENYMVANNFYYRIPDHEPFTSASVGRVWNFHQFSEYTKNAFIVTGKDEYSFITSMYCLYLRNDSMLVKTRMVEIYRKNNTWGINTIADVKYNGLPYDAYQVDDANGTKMYDTLDANIDGYEILAAKTADGNDVVCTWVAPSKIFVFDPPVVTTLGNIDSLMTTDIYGGVRSLNDNNWTGVQFTNDDHYNKLIRMPKVVPNRNTIPMIGHDSRFSTTETVWTTYPAQFQNMNYRTFQVCYPMVFDFSNPEKLWPTSVNDEQQNNFTLNAPYPNPSNGQTEVTFNMNEGANTNIAVYNAMGIKVADLQNGYTSEGVHGLYLNTESYVPGVYYITLTTGTHSATTILNVVR